MVYLFECLCGHSSQVSFPIGKAPVGKRILCPKCFKKEAVRVINSNPAFTINTQFKDSKGTPIWCPDGGYFDRALERPFKSAREKREYMKKKEIVMDGSMSSSKEFNKHPRSGDFKEKAARQKAQMQ